jgi:hypothetical protein
MQFVLDFGKSNPIAACSDESLYLVLGVPESELSQVLGLAVFRLDSALVCCLENLMGTFKRKRVCVESVTVASRRKFLVREAIGKQLDLFAVL